MSNHPPGGIRPAYLSYIFRCSHLNYFIDNSLYQCYSILVQRGQKGVIKMLTLLALYSLPVLMLGYLILDTLAEKIIRFKYRKEIAAIGKI